MPLQQEQLVVGMHIKCIFPSAGCGRLGQTAIIKNIKPDNSFFYVAWDDGSSDDEGWNYASSFEEVTSMSLSELTIDKQQEKPCRVCKRPNYLDARSCWMCGLEKPC